LATSPLEGDDRTLAEMPENALKKTGELSVIKMGTYSVMLELNEAERAGEWFYGRPLI
jgi:hypothetical protein